MAKKVSPPSGARSNHKRSTTSPKAGMNSRKVESRAFEIYAQRVVNGSPGNELSDWLQAESELRADEE